MTEQSEITRINAAYRVERVTLEDLSEIAGWKVARGLPHGWHEHWLAPNGFWVRGIAAGWLVLTDSSRALIEDFVANPDSDARDRGKALFAIEDRIANEARLLGYRYLLGTTHNDSVRDRVRIAGYEVSAANYSLHMKRL